MRSLRTFASEHSSDTTRAVLVACVESFGPIIETLADVALLRSDLHRLCGALRSLGIDEVAEKTACVLASLDEEDSPRDGSIHQEISDLRVRVIEVMACARVLLREMS